MSDEIDLKQATTVFDLACKLLTDKDVQYEKDEKNLTVSFQMKSDDLPMNLNLIVDPKNQIITAISHLPLSFQEDKISEGATAVCFINWILKVGNFDFNVFNGKIVFRLTSSFKDSLISEKMITDMISTCMFTVDEFNDKFFMLSQGMLSLEDFQNKYTK